LNREERVEALRLLRENPEILMEGTHEDRVARILDALPHTPVRVADVLRLVVDAQDRHDHWDHRGGSWKQLNYIFGLAEFTQEEAEEFQRVLIETGGLSMSECGHLIHTLQERKKEVKALEKLYKRGET